MSKSPDAFRTIREVADWLGVAAHVLRFWESKFNQIRPVKRAGGRRYYRPSDMELVGGIKVLLHDRGMTVRGVQRMLRDEGAGAVAALSPPLDEMAVPPELVEGIAEEAAWHDDARAEAATAPLSEHDETDTPNPEAEVADAPQVLADAPKTMPGAQQTSEAELETGPKQEQEPEPAHAPDPAPETATAPDPLPAEAAPDPAPPAPQPAPETVGHGLDRLAAFVAVAKDTPQDDRPRLRPAITALKRLKARMEEPVDGTGT